MSDGLRDKINSELKVAMKAKDKRKISTLRLINAAFKDRDIQNRGTGTDISLDEAGMQAILAKMIKQRRESAQTYDEGGRPELAEAERAEIIIIEAYMPKQMSEGEIGEAVKTVLAELGCEGLKDMGRAMGVLKTRYAGQMDMSKASAMVKDQLG